MTKMLVSMTLALGALASPALAGEDSDPRGAELVLRGMPACHKAKPCGCSGRHQCHSLGRDQDGLRHLRGYKDRRKKPHPGDGRGGLSLLPSYGRDAMAVKDRALIISGAAGAVLAPAEQ